MRFSGRLEGDGVRAVLRLLGTGRSTGVLLLRAPSSRGRLIVCEGRVLQASLDNVAPLGESLVERGAIEQTTMDGALSVQKRTRRNRPLGQILVDLRLLEKQEVGAALEAQVRRVVEELLSWREGSYAFEPLATPVDDPEFEGVEIASLIGEPEVAR